MNRSLVVIASEKTDAALPLLHKYAEANRAGTANHHVFLICSRGVSSAERKLLREFGWQGQQGNAEDALDVLKAHPHQQGILVHAGTTSAPQGTSPVPILTVTVNPTHPPSPNSSKKKLAAFLVATHNRPQILEAVLDHLMAQQVPNGWTYEILVAGVAADLGQEVVARYPIARFYPVTSTKVTDKLNHLARHRTQALLLCMADDDDLQPPNRLAAAIKAHEGGAGWAASGLHRFVDLRTGTVARWEGSAASGYVGTSVSVDRKLFLDVGGYPSVSSGKDGHLTYRINLKAPGTKFKDLSSEIGHGLICLQHSGNLHQRPFPAMGKAVRRGRFTVRGEGKVSQADVSESTCRTLVKLGVSESDVPPPRPSTIVRTPPAHLRPHNTIVGSLASIPGRVAMLAEVVQNLVPQVDQLNVYLNGYDQVPSFLQHPKVVVARSQDYGDRGDAGKFFWADDILGFHLTFDDDIHYPGDVVHRLVQAIEKYERKAAVSFHGATLPPQPRDYYRSRTQYHCANALSQDINVNVLGTGIMGFHASALRVSRSDFPVPNMADVWFALLGQRNQVPFVCLRRDGHYIRPMPTGTASIYTSSSKRDNSSADTAQIQAKTVRENAPWRIFRT